MTVFKANNTLDVVLENILKAVRRIPNRMTSDDDFTCSTLAVSLNELENSVADTTTHRTMLKTVVPNFRYVDLTDAMQPIFTCIPRHPGII